MYRYRILNYNVLGRIGAVSEWTGIRIFIAKQPAAKTYSPAGYFVDSLAGEFTLTITGHDLGEEAQVYIVSVHKVGYFMDRPCICSCFVPKQCAKCVF